MYNSFELAGKYLRYYLRASNGKGHGMHSPFVFNFILDVLNNRQGFIPPDEIEQLRIKLLSDSRLVEIEDLGAGSRMNSATKKTVAQIARTALKSKRLAQVLFRLGKYYRPAKIIELGTSLGLTTSYFSKALPDARIITIEGSPAIAAVAGENFQKLGCGNIELLNGNFDDLLPIALDRLSTVDLAYIDGNHRYEPTIRYFLQALAKVQSNSILVFDDIHWSPEMEKAWEEIKAHPSVQYSIDIFFLGFVFFRNEFKVKQHFSIRF
jgi:predicted O-methyltransferase YrrM